MSVIRLLLAAEAAQKLVAVRRTACLHRHLSERPFVVAAFNLSGEAAAPLGFCYGTDRQTPKLVIAAEPRNRDSRFSVINTFAADLTDYIAPFLVLREVETKDGTARVVEDAPQIVVPNRATRDYLGARLGRSIRYLGQDDSYPVPATTPWAGAHLSFLAEHAHCPGQSTFLSATELLGRHFVTGQSELEDEKLSSFLAWIDNDPRQGRARIEAAEDAAYGPVPDPTWEIALEPLLKEWTLRQREGDTTGMEAIRAAVEAIVGPKLREAYEATWRALDIARAIPPAASVAKRWEMDRREWEKHARRAEQSLPRFSTRHNALRAAYKLEQWSRALEQLDFQEAIDDPLVLAELDAAGRCVSGEVTRIDLDHKEIKPGNKKATQVPLVTVRLAGPSTLLVGESVIWSKAAGVEGEIRSIDDETAVLAIMGGHVKGTRLPPCGSTAIFAAMSTFGGLSPQNPDGVPWTHRAAESTQDQSPEPEAQEEEPEREDQDDSPDRTTDDLLGLPIIGDIAPDAVPQVVL